MCVFYIAQSSWELPSGNPRLAALPPSPASDQSARSGSGAGWLAGRGFFQASRLQSDSCACEYCPYSLVLRSCYSSRYWTCNSSWCPPFDLAELRKSLLGIEVLKGNDNAMTVRVAGQMWSRFNVGLIKYPTFSFKKICPQKRSKLLQI